MDDFGELFAGLLIIVAVCAVVALLLSAATIMAGVGGVVGGGTAVRNYVISFRKNVYPDRI